MQLSRDLIGQKIGDYRLDALLGEGGMGVVYRGVHEALGQIVAIKMLHPALMEDEKIKSRFLREAQRLARLNHPNIVRLISFLDREDTYFIVMEYIEGQTIDKIMSTKGIIPSPDAAEWYTQVLAAMHYAHSLGIVHRDIKPSNICILNQQNIVKVLDFGTAKMLGAQRLTQEGMTLGTLIYMSPEQICGRELDHRSDIYSLGVTLYEMVTGKLPHYDDDEMALVKAIARGVPQPPSVHYKHIPPRFEKLIMRAIEKDPAKRFQTAEEFLHAVKEFLNEQRMKERKQTPPSGQRAVVAEPERPAPGAALAPAGPAASPAAAPTAPASAFTPARLLLSVAALGCLVDGGAMLAGVQGGGVIGGAAALLVGAGAAAAAAKGSLWGARSAPSTAPIPPPQGTGTTPAAGSPQSMPAALGGTMDQGAAPRAKAPTGPPPPPPPVPVDTLRSPAPAGPVRAGAAAPPPQQATTAAAAYIYVIEGADKGRSWPLPHGAITIGRGAHNTIALNDPGVSTSHAQIGFDGTSFVSADLQSRNGSYINNQRVSCSPLRDRDIVVFGTTQIVIAIPT